MRYLIGLIGLVLVSLGISTWLIGIKAGLCVGLIIAGIGLFIDALRK